MLPPFSISHFPFSPLRVLDFPIPVRNDSVLCIPDCLEGNKGETLWVFYSLLYNPSMFAMTFSCFVCNVSMCVPNVSGVWRGGGEREGKGKRSDIHHSKHIQTDRPGMRMWGYACVRLCIWSWRDVVRVIYIMEKGNWKLVCVPLCTEICPTPPRLYWETE